jgi:hypothetical protein
LPHENPVMARVEALPQDYLYSSARYYTELKGFIEVDYW